MFSYTAIVGSGDGGRTGSCYADAGPGAQIVRREIIVGRRAMVMAATLELSAGDAGARTPMGGIRDSL